jgi:hypothetical protein
MNPGPAASAGGAAASVGAGGASEHRRRTADCSLAEAPSSKHPRTTELLRVDEDQLAHERTPAYAQLTAVQKAIMARMIPLLNSETDSVVITNPLVPNSPIVHVTQAWQAMCGYTTREACGQNPRFTQGANTDPDTIRHLSHALQQQKPCKVRLLNYRGYSGEPFWNCLTVHPVFHKKQLVLFAARLQDYSHRLNRLTSITPAQFCKMDDNLVCRISLAKMGSARDLAQPHPPAIMAGRIEELDDEEMRPSSSGYATTSDADEEDEVLPNVPASMVKRLCFPRLPLEPEYLRERLQDECASLSWGCHMSEVTACGLGIIRLEVVQPDPTGVSEGVRALVHVLPEQDGGVYTINITRLSGDTFRYHALYRRLKERLSDLLVPGEGPSSLNDTFP